MAAAMIWNTQACNRAGRLKRAQPLCDSGGKICRPELATALLEGVVEAGDRVVLEGDNQKQADLLAHALAQVDAARIHDLHMVQSVLALPEGYVANFRKRRARPVDPN
jgi:malonate decarboxylase alpha subunit